MKYYDGKSGFLTVISGPMWSEKSGELIKRCIYEEKYGRKKVIAFKPSNDTRFSEDEVVSRIGLKYPATIISKNIDSDTYDKIIHLSKYCDMVAFDEGQFFNEKILDIAEELAYQGKHIVIDGLNMDFRGKSFGYMGQLMSISDEHIECKAYCNCCGRPAIFTQRLVDGFPAEEGGQIEIVGDNEVQQEEHKIQYEPRCRLCYIPPHKAKEYIAKYRK